MVKEYSYLNIHIHSNNQHQNKSGFYLYFFTSFYYFILCLFLPLAAGVPAVSLACMATAWNILPLCFTLKWKLYNCVHTNCRLKSFFFSRVIMGRRGTLTHTQVDAYKKRPRSHFVHFYNGFIFLWMLYYHKPEIKCVCSFILQKSPLAHFWTINAS